MKQFALILGSGPSAVGTMQDPTRSDDRRSQASPCCVCSGVKATLTFAWIARERAYLRDLGRAFGGALLFMLPLLMTMEMWAFGFSMERGRLFVFLAAALPLLYGLDFYAGLSARRGAVDDLRHCDGSGGRLRQAGPTFSVAG